jgi:hypothetical protein
VAVVLIEGFDFYQAAKLTARGWSSASASMTTGRFTSPGSAPAQACRPTTGITKLLPAAAGTLIAGFAVKFTTFNGAANDFFAFRTGTVTNIARVGVNASNQIIVRNVGGTTIATGATVLTSGVWYYVEVKIFVNGASGTCEVHLNGAAEIASTVGNFGSTNMDNFTMLPSAATNTDFDDMYCLDTTGAAPRNTFLGDVRVGTIMPTADGAHSQFTPSSGSAHFSLVNEVSGTFPDGDTSYVSDATPGDYDTSVFEDIDGGATVLAVQASAYARKDDANVRQIADVVRQSGTDHDGATVTLASSYTYYSHIWNQDGAGADWTAAAVNAAEFGIKCVA